MGHFVGHLFFSYMGKVGHVFCVFLYDFGEKWDIVFIIYFRVYMFCNIL